MSLHPKPTKPKKTIAAAEPVVQEPKAKRLGVFSRIKKWIKRIVLLVLLLVIVVPIGVYMTQPNYYRVLIIGSDQRDTERARSDVLMVVNVPKSDKNPFSMVMIPRDTKIEHEEYGLEKITHFYAKWEEDEYLGNKDLTQKVVEDLLGVKMHGTVEVTFDSFIDIVDLVGGVDTSSGHLDGATAKEAVHNRFVQAEGDFGRAANQREILRNLLSRFKQPSNATAVYDYFTDTKRARLDISTTSTGLFGAAYVVGHKGNLSLGEVEEVIIPGQGERIYTPDFNKELYYWVLDEASIEETVDNYMK